MNVSAKVFPGVCAPKAAAFPRPAFTIASGTATSPVVFSSSFSSRLLLGSTASRGRRNVVTNFKTDDEKAEEVEQAAGAQKVAHPTLFKLKQHCAYGQQWRVCGNLPELGKWDPVAALPMVWGPDDQWFALVDLPEGQHIEYKHVLYDEHTGKYFWVQDGMTTNMALEVLPNTHVSFGPSSAVVGGPDAPDVRRMEAELEEKRAAAMCTVELQRVSEETPAVESLPFGKTVEQEFTESPLESRETGPRGPVGPLPQVQPEQGYKPPTDVPASVEAVPPGEVLEETVPAIPGVTYATKDTLPAELGIVGAEEENDYAHGSFEIVNEMPINPIAVPPSSLRRASCHICGGIPPTESFREQVLAANEAAGLTKAAREQGVAPEEPTAEELAGATAAAEPPLPEQMEQAHIAGAASPASGAMMSDAAAMTPRNRPNAAASLLGHAPGPQLPHAFVPKIELVDPAEERALAAQTHMEHEVDVAASYVQQLVRHAGRVASRAAQTMGLPEGVEAEKSRDASRKVADAAMDAAGGFGDFANGDFSYEGEDASAAMERAQEAAHAAMSAAADAAQAAAKKAKAAALQAQQGTTDSAQSAAAVAASAAERAQEAAEAAAHAAKHVSKDTTHAAKEVAWEARGFAEQAQGKAEASAQAGKHVVKDSAHAAEEVAQEARGFAEQAQGKAEAAAQAGKHVVKDSAHAAEEVAKEAKEGAKKLASRAVEMLAELPPDMDVAGDPTSAAVARQLEQEDPESLDTSSSHTLSDAVSSAAQNLKEVPRKVAGGMRQAMHTGTEENPKGGIDAQQQRPGSPPRGSAPGGLQETWDYTKSKPLVKPSKPTSSAPTASDPPSKSNPSMTSRPQEGAKPERPQSSNPGDSQENVINWVSENTPEEKQKIENLPEEAFWTPGGLGGQLGTESTQEDRDSWVPKAAGEGGYSPSVAQGTEPQGSGQRGASGFTQRNDADTGRDQPPHYSPPSREGMGSIMAAHFGGSEGEDDPDADGSARLRSMSSKDREQELLKDFMQPRTPEGAGSKFESVAEAAQSSRFIPKPSKEAAEAAARREEEESPIDPSQPLFNPRLAYMKRAERDALQQEAHQQASQFVPEEYEAPVEAGGGGGAPRPEVQGSSQEGRKDVLEEPQGLPHTPSVGEEASVQDVE